MYVQPREVDASKAEARREGFVFNKTTPEERRSLHAAKLGSMVGGTMSSAAGGAAGSSGGSRHSTSAPASPAGSSRRLPEAPSAADTEAAKKRVANRQAQSMEEMSKRAQALMWRPPP